MFDLLKFLKLHFKKQTAFEISMGRQFGFWASRPPLQHFGVFLVLKMIMIILMILIIPMIVMIPMITLHPWFQQLG